MPPNSDSSTEEGGLTPLQPGSGAARAAEHDNISAKARRRKRWRSQNPLHKGAKHPPTQSQPSEAANSFPTNPHRDNNVPYWLNPEADQQLLESLKIRRKRIIFEKELKIELDETPIKLNSEGFFVRKNCALQTRNKILIQEWVRVSDGAIFFALLDNTKNPPTVKNLDPLAHRNICPPLKITKRAAKIIDLRDSVRFSDSDESDLFAMFRGYLTDAINQDNTAARALAVDFIKDRFPNLFSEPRATTMRVHKDSTPDSSTQKSNRLKESNSGPVDAPHQPVSGAATPGATAIVASSPHAPGDAAASAARAAVTITIEPATPHQFPLAGETLRTPQFTDPAPEERELAETQIASLQSQYRGYVFRKTGLMINENLYAVRDKRFNGGEGETLEIVRVNDGKNFFFKKLDLLYKRGVPQDTTLQEQKATMTERASTALSKECLVLRTTEHGMKCHRIITLYRSVKLDKKMNAVRYLPNTTERYHEQEETRSRFSV